MKFEFNHLEKSVLDSLSKKGRVYLVGGIVRDMVMYQKVDYHDVDVEIYDLEIDEIIDILSQYGISSGFKNKRDLSKNGQ